MSEAAERLMDWLAETCPCDHYTPCDCKRRREAMVVALEETEQLAEPDLLDRGAWLSTRSSRAARTNPFPDSRAEGEAMKFRRGGTQPSGSFEERFWMRVNKQGPVWNGSPCWVWLGSTAKGYGRLRCRTKTGRWRFVVAHRWSYEQAHGPIPSRMELDHLCRNRGCVNPAHLEVVTSRENTLRGSGPSAQCARKTHCKRGHALTPENTYVYPKSANRPKRQRKCKTCNRLRQQGKLHV